LNTDILTGSTIGAFGLGAWVLYEFVRIAITTRIILTLRRGRARLELIAKEDLPERARVVLTAGAAELERLGWHPFLFVHQPCIWRSPSQGGSWWHVLRDEGSAGFAILEVEYSQLECTFAALQFTTLLENGHVVITRQTPDIDEHPSTTIVCADTSDPKAAFERHRIATERARGLVGPLVIHAPGDFLMVAQRWLDEVFEREVARGKWVLVGEQQYRYGLASAAVVATSSRVERKVQHVVTVH
jgi:hypothetical protein